MMMMPCFIVSHSANVQSGITLFIEAGFQRHSSSAAAAAATAGCKTPTRSCWIYPRLSMIQSLSSRTVDGLAYIMRHRSNGQSSVPLWFLVISSYLRNHWAFRGWNVYNSFKLFTVKCQYRQSFLLYTLCICSVAYIHRVPKNVQNCFCQNFVKYLPTLIIFGTQITQRIGLYEVHSFSTSPN